MTEFIKTIGYWAVCIVVVVIAFQSCSTTGKLRRIRSQEVRSDISLPDIQGINSEMDSVIKYTHRDTVTVVGENGEQLFLMKAIRDEQTGEMVANEQIDAAVISARFRNVAERHGKVDISFRLKVPVGMRDSKWQLRFTPRMILGDKEELLDPVYVTGKDYRKVQLRGYQQYQRFLNSIITDSTLFLNRKQLEFFLMRYLPQVYAFRDNMDIVSDEQFQSCYGVTEREAINHYTSKIKISKNDRRISRKDAVYRRFVKVPIRREGLRLDTVYNDGGGSFIYDYVQTVPVNKSLKKVGVILSGSIYEQSNRLYNIPDSQPLEYYISSFSTLVENRVRYMTAVIERSVAADMTSFIDFEQGRHEVKTKYHDNEHEISRIRKTFLDLLEDEVFDLDSIIVTAYASPEGSSSFNNTLCSRRSQSVRDYFTSIMRHLRDSLTNEGGFNIDMAGRVSQRVIPKSISIRARNGGEDWNRFSELIHSDNSITDAQKRYFDKCSVFVNPDAKEEALRADKDFYKYSRDNIYPRLRRVRFDFHLHRRGMIKDTIHTTVVDTTYMNGVKALVDRDYERAVALLRPYGDYNSALAFVAMDYNTSALSVLEHLERDARVNYMLAVVYSRIGKTQEAVQCYLNACKEDRTFIHRGNLDPEISALIKAYKLENLTLEGGEYDI